MKKTIITLFICLLLSGCGFLKPYRPPVQQGNVITDQMVQEIRAGMTKSQIQDKLGEPVLENCFDPNTWSYVYTLLPSKGTMTEKQLIIHFKNDRVSSFTGDLPSPKVKKDPAACKKVTK